MSESKTIRDWQGYCAQLLNDFFVVTPQSETILLLIEDEWEKLLIGAADYNESISVTILHDAMQSRLEQHHLTHHFLTGKINFCTMMPMRSIPFKVVCLLGMNDGVYPRVSLPLDFDLIAYQTRRGDRSRRNDDRYLFLEAILAAQNQLYISYIGRDIKDNSERYPSVLVDELWEYITQHYSLTVDSQTGDLKKNHSVDKQSLKFLRITHTRTPFNPKNYLNEPKSYAAEWLPAAAKTGFQQQFIHDLPPIIVDKIDLDELKRFYQHTIRLFLQKRLHYYVNYLGDTLPDAENFNLDGLERYQLNQRILTQLIESEHLSTQPVVQTKPDDFYQRILLSGELPDGAFGTIIYDEQYEMMQELADRIKQKRHVQFSQEVNLIIPSLSSEQSLYTQTAGELNSCKLQGWLMGVQDDGILQWRPTKLSIRDGMALWIDHLVYCLLNPDNSASHSLIYGRKGSEWQFAYINADESLNILTTLIDGYRQGINHPLLMPLQSAWHWLGAAYNDKTGEIDASFKAETKLINTWQGGFNQAAECDDYYFRLYPELTTELITQITNAAQHFLLPLLQHRMITESNG